MSEILFYKILITNLFVCVFCLLYCLIRTHKKYIKSLREIFRLQIKEPLPNVSEPIISKRYLLTCNSCFYINEFKVTNKGVVEGAKELKNGN